MHICEMVSFIRTVIRYAKLDLNFSLAQPAYTIIGTYHFDYYLVIIYLLIKNPCNFIVML